MENQKQDTFEKVLPDLMRDLNSVLAQHNLMDLRIKRLELIEKRNTSDSSPKKKANKIEKLNAIASNEAIQPPPIVPEGCTAKFSAALKKWIIICP